MSEELKPCPFYATPFSKFWPQLVTGFIWASVIMFWGLFLWWLFNDVIIYLEKA